MMNNDKIGGPLVFKYIIYSLAQAIQTFFSIIWPVFIIIKAHQHPKSLWNLYHFYRLRKLLSLYLKEKTLPITKHCPKWRRSTDLATGLKLRIFPGVPSAVTTKRTSSLKWSILLNFFFPSSHFLKVIHWKSKIVILISSSLPCASFNKQLHSKQ